MKSPLMLASDVNIANPLPNFFLMSKVRKAIREQLIAETRTYTFCQKIVNQFNTDINKKMAEMNEKMLDYQEMLVKLEK
jgi:hypothetical protein